MMKELAAGILLFLILACAILVSKLKHYDKRVVAESLIGYKCVTSLSIQIVNSRLSYFCRNILRNSFF